MEQKNLKFRKGDLIAVAVVLAAAVLSAVFLPALTQKGEFAEIYQNGKLIRTVPLDVNQTFEIAGDYTNTITVKDGRIAVTASDCPNLDCMHQGWKDSGSIICLPNHMEIRLKTGSPVDFQVR